MDLCLEACFSFQVQFLYIILHFKHGINNNAYQSYQLCLCQSFTADFFIVTVQFALHQ